MLLRDMAQNVGFGTSGVRGLVSELTPTLVQAYTQAFVRHLVKTDQLPLRRCVVGWDLRPSSPEIAASVCSALQSAGCTVELAGLLPTPALALHAMTIKAAGIMVTGSHIPFDRNGVKFYTPMGEILKSDEIAMTDTDLGDVPAETAARAGAEAFIEQIRRGAQVTSAALAAYTDRYLHFLASAPLQEMRVGVYQHSAVGRDFLVDLLERLGCCVVPLGRSEAFVPIDTEAVSADDEVRAAQWCAQFELDAVVSTDGDGDRPWICDEQGHFIRGDVVGILTARWLGAQSVVTPVSSNTALEKCGHFARCVRTRIGSPYVIEAMNQLREEKADHIVGFEANGGFLLQTAMRRLAPLPTRDSTLPILALLTLARQERMPLSGLPGLLPARFTQAGRIQGIRSVDSVRLLNQLEADAGRLASFLRFSDSTPVTVDRTDGLRVELANAEIVHLRQSGNAPELRCYVEAASPDRASVLVTAALETLRGECPLQD